MIAIAFRHAVEKDLESIVQLIAADELGSTREEFRIPLPDKYVAAFRAIAQDDNQELIVVENDQFEIVGTLQLSFIQYLTYRGGIRAQIEAVRVKENYRGEGIGRRMFEWAIDRAQDRKAHLLQLTTDKRRPKAIKFYEELGFRPSHVGMKMHFGQK